MLGRDYVFPTLSSTAIRVITTIHSAVIAVITVFSGAIVFVDAKVSSAASGSIVIVAAATISSAVYIIAVVVSVLLAPCSRANVSSKRWVQDIPQGEATKKVQGVFFGGGCTNID